MCQDLGCVLKNGKQSLKQQTKQNKNPYLLSSPFTAKTDVSKNNDNAIICCRFYMYQVLFYGFYILTKSNPSELDAVITAICREGKRKRRDKYLVPSHRTGKQWSYHSNPGCLLKNPRIQLLQLKCE